MKMHPFFILIFMVVVTACAPQSVATPPPTPANTITPLAVTTPEPQPTHTLESTRISIPVTNVSLDSCTQIIEAKVSDSGILEVVYAGGMPSLDVISKFGLAEYTELWLWTYATQAETPFPLPSDALNPKLSADRYWVVFRRDIGEKRSELWVIDAQGQYERKIVTFSFDEIQARYPNLAGPFDLELGLNYGWVPNTDKIIYSIAPGGGIDIYIYDTVALLDVDSGQVISLAKPGEEISKVVIAPDGSQAAVLTASELRLVNTKDGKVQFTLPMPLSSYGVEGSRTPAYSPDSKYVIDFTDDGIMRMNIEDGQWQILPLKYATITTVGGDSPTSRSPDFTWVDNSTMLLPIPDNDQQSVVQPREPDPNSTFTVWQVDLATGAAHPIHTFTGYQPSVKFSPMGNRLAFQKYQGVAPSQTTDLFLADLATGKILETIEDGQFETWSPDSNKYIYSTGHPTQKGDTDNSKYYLGMIGGKPILMNWPVLDDAVWMDPNRLVMDCKIMQIP